MADIKGDAKKEFLGQPAWIWAVAGLVTIAAGIYLYRKNAANQASTAATAGGTTATPATGTSSFYGWLLDQQGSPTATATATATSTGSSCPPGMFADSKGICRCPKGYIWDKRIGHCTKIGSKGKVLL